MAGTATADTSLKPATQKQLLQLRRQSLTYLAQLHAMATDAPIDRTLRRSARDHEALARQVLAMRDRLTSLTPRSSRERQARQALLKAYKYMGVAWLTSARQLRYVSNTPTGKLDKQKSGNLLAQAAVDKKLGLKSLRLGLGRLGFTSAQMKTLTPYMPGWELVTGRQRTD